MTLVGAFASQLGVPSFIAKMVEKGPVAEKRGECCLSLLGADASSEDLRENPTLRKRGTSRAKHVDSHTGHEYRWDASLMPSSSTSPSQRPQSFSAQSVCRVTLCSGLAKRWNL